MLVRIVRTIIVWLALVWGLVACAAPTSTPERSPAVPDPAVTPSLIPSAALPDMGVAPPIENEVWLNTKAPLSLQALQGKVVLIEFWTFG